MTPLVAAVMLQVGWRWTAFLSGVLVILVGLPLSQLIRHRPEAYGWRVDGDAADAEPTVAAARVPTRREFHRAPGHAHPRLLAHLRRPRRSAARRLRGDGAHGGARHRAAGHLAGPGGGRGVDHHDHPDRRAALRRLGGRPLQQARHRGGLHGGACRRAAAPGACQRLLDGGGVRHAPWAGLGHPRAAHGRHPRGLLRQRVLRHDLGHLVHGGDAGDDRGPARRGHPRRPHRQLRDRLHRAGDAGRAGLDLLPARPAARPAGSRSAPRAAAPSAAVTAPTS